MKKHFIDLISRGKYYPCRPECVWYNSKPLKATCRAYFKASTRQLPETGGKMVQAVVRPAKKK